MNDFLQCRMNEILHCRIIELVHSRMIEHLQFHQYPAAYLVTAASLLAIGLFGLIRRRTLIGMLVSAELIFSAASLNFMVMNAFFAPDRSVGQIFVLFIMGLAAAEVAIVLSIVIAVYRNYRSIDAGELTDLNG